MAGFNLAKNGKVVTLFYLRKIELKVGKLAKAKVNPRGMQSWAD